MTAGKLWNQVKKYKFIYVMLLPIAIYFIVFSYYPLALGITLSFRKSKLIGTPEFAGLANYKDVFSSPLYIQAFVNTVIVGVFTFIAQFAFGLLLALSLNEIKSKFVKSAIQSVTYMPYLLSWAIVGGMWITILSPSGMLNGIRQIINGTDFSTIVFMSEPKFARIIMVLTGAWKGAGYFAVLFIAAIVSINEVIYESANIDGATRLKQIIHITIPNLVPTMKVIIVLGSMGILRNFDQIFVMGNSTIYNEVRNLLYLIYTDGIVNFKVGLATAAATLVLIATFLLSTLVRKLTRYDETYN
jgi:putative aldouronate transport system permease protein